MIKGSDNVLGALEKIAVVKGVVKQHRRALQMLTEGDQVFHGVTERGTLASLLKSREVRPGGRQMLSKGGVPESYWGSRRPSLYHAAGNPVIVKPRKRLKGREVDATKHEQYGVDKGGTGHWFLSKKNVPLSRKDTLVVGENTTKAEISSARKARMRVIGAKPFWEAHLRATPSGRLQSMRGEVKRKKTLKEHLRSLA